MKKSLFVLIAMLLLLAFKVITVTAQSNIDHWETLFYPFQESKYFIGSQEPDINWNKPNYVVTNSWKKGVCAIGDQNTFGQCDQCNKIAISSSLYVRTIFTIKDTADINELLLQIEYIDGFVAYINGIEVLRANLGAPKSKTTYNQMADSVHVIDFYGIHESNIGFQLTKDVFRKNVINGDNLLAIEVHNKVGASDLFGFYMYMFAGMKKPGKTYLDNSFNGFPLPVAVDSTYLPIVLLDVPFNLIPDNPRTIATMKIIDNGPGKINHPSDINYAYKGKISIERRGSSSQQQPKHSYGFSTLDASGKDTSVSLMGYPKENDWILKGEFQDKSLLRDVFSYNLARKMGHYASRTNFVELFINGVNLGLFNLFEKVKRDTFRVSIAKLPEADSAGQDVSGGYILKLDKSTGSGGGAGFPSKYRYLANSGVPFFQYDYPKSDMITSAEKVYIKNFMTEFETALRSPYYKDSTKGYRNYISTKSFIDYMVMQELSKNIDGYRLSTYMYKTRDKADKKGLLHMGPIWDLNLAYGYSASLCSGNWKDIGWAYNYNTNCPSDQWFVPFWYDRLLQDPAFRDELKTRWDILRKGPLQTDSLMNNIDTLIKQMGPARIRNFKIWDNVFLVQIWPGNQVANSYEGEIEYFKNFIRKRLIWLDTNIPDVHAEVTYNDIESPLSLVEIGQVRIYPNPFTDQLKIDYIVSDPTIVRLSIFNFMGQKIITMENMSSANEINSFTWNGTNENGALVKPGIYLYTLELKNSVVVRGKLIKK